MASTVPGMRDPNQINPSTGKPVAPVSTPAGAFGNPSYGGSGAGPVAPTSLSPDQKAFIAGGYGQTQANQAQIDLLNAQLAYIGRAPTGGGGGGGAGAALANRQADIQIAAAQRQLGTLLPTLYRNAASDYEVQRERALQALRSGRQSYVQTNALLRARGRDTRRENRDQTNAFRSDSVARGASIAPGTEQGFQSLADQLGNALAQIEQQRRGAATQWSDVRSGTRSAVKSAKTQLRGQVAQLVEQQADLRDRIAQLELQKQLNLAGGGGGGDPALAYQRMMQAYGVQQQILGLQSENDWIQSQIDGVNATIDTSGRPGHAPRGPVGPVTPTAPSPFGDSGNYNPIPRH